MKIPVKIYVMLLLLVNSQWAVGQDKDVALKPAEVISGKLPNGMRYYIKQNSNPKDRAAFYLAHNVGSVLEEEGQLGLAHFLEHMAFNGTRNFEDKKMLDYLQENGIKFGTEINAFTDYDESVYSIRNVLVHKEQVLDSILLILHDWSGGLTLSDEEIDKERGVVWEEWRSRYHPRKIAEDTVKNQGLLKGSRYAKRTPIGSMDVINNFDYEELKSFYRKWYRPDLQAVIVVGDIDAAGMEEKIKSLFSDIPLRAHSPDRPGFEVPIEEELNYLTVTDKELGTPVIAYFIKHPRKAGTEKQALEHQVKAGLLNTLISQRFSQNSTLPSSPVLSVRFSLEKVVRPLEVLKLNIQPKRDSLLPALEFGISELRRLQVHGVNPDEFEKIKASSIRNLQSSLNKSSNSNVYYAIKIYESFLENRELIDEHSQWKYQLQYLEGLEPQDLQDFFNEYYTSQGNVVAITGTNALQYPSREEVLESVNRVRSSSPVPYKEIVLDNRLMDLDLSGGKIVKEEEVHGGKATRFTLSNGARVWLFSPLTEGEGIHFKALSPGGRSQLQEELLTNSLFATVFTGESGIANLSKRALMGSDEISVVRVNIEDYQETLEGYTNAHALENLSKGIYLAFTAPRFDPQIFEVNKQGLENIYATLKGNAQGEFVDSVQVAKSNYSERVVLFSQKVLDDLSMERIEQIYRDRIKNAGDFDFVFMGAVDNKQFAEYLEKYIGSIPGNPVAEQAVNHHMTPTPGLHKVHLSREMGTPQAMVHIHLTGKMAFTNENELVMRMMEELLTKRYMQRIREEEGGTYGVKVKGVLQHIPEEVFELDISFSSHPEKAEDLVKIVYEELTNLSTRIDKAALLEIKTNLEKEIKEKAQNNNQYFNKIIRSVVSGTAITTAEEEVQMIRSITEAELMEAAAQINDRPGIVEGILLPK